MNDEEAKQYIMKAIEFYASKYPPETWDFIEAQDEGANGIRFTADFMNESEQLLIMSIDVQAGIMKY